MWGGKGTDHLYGHAGRDELHGGPGSDFLFGDYRRWSNAIDSDRLDGGAGFDTLGGDRGNDLLYGGKGKDHLYGHDGDDTLFSGMGPGDGTQGVMDLMEGSTGKDTFLIEQDPLTKLPINGQSDIATEIRDFQPAEGDVKKMLSVSDLKKLFDWVEKW